MRKMLCLAAALSLLSLSLYGQTLGTITGEVRDPSAAVAANVAVTATNTGTNAVRRTVTTDQGVYSFPGLVPGPYEVRVEAPGFRPAARSLTLEVQQTARVDFKLEVGEVTSRVEVSAAAVMLTTENATVGTVIENRRIVDLPLNGRNFLQLVALSPNVSYGVSRVGHQRPRRRRRAQARTWRFPACARRGTTTPWTARRTTTRTSTRTCFCLLSIHSGVQGSDRHLSREFGRDGDADQRLDQGRHEQLPRRLV